MTKQQIISTIFVILGDFAQGIKPFIKLLDSGVIYIKAPFPQCHASTLVELNKNSYHSIIQGNDRKNLLSYTRK